MKFEIDTEALINILVACLLAATIVFTVVQIKSCSVTETEIKARAGK